MLETPRRAAPHRIAYPKEEIVYFYIGNELCLVVCKLIFFSTFPACCTWDEILSLLYILRQTDKPKIYVTSVEKLIEFIPKKKKFELSAKNDA